MTYIIAEPCIDIKDRSCVDVCPVDCIHEFERLLVIDPEECIDCGACEPVCPTKAIYPEGDLPAEYAEYKALNVELSATWPVISEKKDALPEAEQYKDKKGKRGLLDK